MKHHFGFIKKISLFLVVSCALFPTLNAQKADKILELLQEGKITKAVEKRNQVYTKDKDLILIDICDCILFNSPQYKAYNPVMAYEKINEIINSGNIINTQGTKISTQDQQKITKFLKKHGSSLDKIKGEIENNLLADAKKTNTEEGYAKILTLCNNCSFRQEAMMLKENAAYNETMEKGTIDAYNYFLANYPESDKVEEITQIVDKIIFSKLSNTIESYSAFIQQYPHSTLVPEAQKRIYALAYDQATAQNTLEGYTSLIQRYPEHPMKTEIQAKIEEMSYQDLLQNCTLKKYDTFIAAFPQSEYRAKAENLLRRIDKSRWNIQADGLKGYVKSVNEITLSEGSRKSLPETSTMTQYNELGQTTLVQTTSGKEIKATQLLYRADFSLNSAVTPTGNEKYFYIDGTNRLSKITFVNNRKKESTLQTFTYKNDLPSQQTVFVSGVKYITLYTFENDTLVSTKKYKATTPKNTTIDTFDKTGKLTNRSENIGKTVSNTQYKYNDKGDLIKTINVKAAKETVTTYEYIYDESGNWVKQSCFINGNLSTVKQRSIEYYK
ncbi:tetratricopeptide repeat protein [Coprobacter tertius]|uniref:YD repeat (Two copies) n=1 Tax=Coprobacter tertius TaxID=2944915 RepID=A0ABT1MMS2_9BACT|nr:hypothetical protein [Coprobacter tertius]MCP9613058.1 hypothetical protein [Coprobacter tertius]